MIYHSLLHNILKRRNAASSPLACCHAALSKSHARNPGQCPPTAFAHCRIRFTSSQVLLDIYICIYIDQTCLMQWNTALPLVTRIAREHPENARIGRGSPTGPRDQGTRDQGTKAGADGPFRSNPEIPYTISENCPIATRAPPEIGIFEPGGPRRGGEESENGRKWPKMAEKPVDRGPWTVSADRDVGLHGMTNISIDRQPRDGPRGCRSRRSAARPHRAHGLMGSWALGRGECQTRSEAFRQSCR